MTPRGDLSLWHCAKKFIGICILDQGAPFLRHSRMICPTNIQIVCNTYNIYIIYKKVYCIKILFFFQKVSRERYFFLICIRLYKHVYIHSICICENIFFWIWWRIFLVLWSLLEPNKHLLDTNQSLTDIW